MIRINQFESQRWQTWLFRSCLPQIIYLNNPISFSIFQTDFMPCNETLRLRFGGASHSFLLFYLTQVFFNFPSSSFSAPSAPFYSAHSPFSSCVIYFLISSFSFSSFFTAFLSFHHLLISITPSSPPGILVSSSILSPSSSLSSNSPPQPHFHPTHLHVDPFSIAFVLEK